MALDAVMAGWITFTFHHVNQIGFHSAQNCY
jgi:hypothetical protein